MAEAELMALSSESSFAGCAPTDSCSNSASLSSTPPTSVSEDNISLASDTHKPEIEQAIALLEQPSAAGTPDEPVDAASVVAVAVASVIADVVVGADIVADAEHNDTAVSPPEPAATEPPAPTRPRRARHSEPVYNLAKLAGTNKRGRRLSKGDALTGRGARRTITNLADLTPETATPDGAATPTVSDPDVHAAPQQNIVVGEGEDEAARPPEQEDKVRALRPRRSSSAVTGAGTSKNTRAATDAPGTKTKPGPRKGPVPAASTMTRRSTRSSGVGVEDMATALSAMSKRARKGFEQSHSIIRELKRLADTNEFSKIEDKPVLQTVWSNGKFVDPTTLNQGASSSSSEPARKKARTEEQEEEGEQPKKKEEDQQPAPASAPGLPKPRRVKKWLDRGLYAGQVAPVGHASQLSVAERKAIAQIPELAEPAAPNSALPFPIYGGLRMLMNGRDFKLPFDICHPLQDQPKPKDWKKITKSRFVGESNNYWNKKSYYDNRSTCVCTEEDGCGEACLNRSVLYECNDVNCNIGREHCRNRAFQDLQDRTKKGGRYRTGVEVFHTGGRGFGVRSNRCFAPGQIIMEYAGEIITEEECDRRMNEVYKDKECYYLMSFDQNMILDATTGSIARFVNHSCSPNCRMIKWIVSGTPRMALFAGDRPIMTGDELTYDYNFDPFSAKNVQKCLCGSQNCRGILGPRNRNDTKGNGKKGAAASLSPKKEGPSPSAAQKKKKKEVVAERITTTKAAKRKLQDLLGLQGDDAERGGKSQKKRRAAVATAATAGVKKAANGAKNAVAKIKRSVSSSASASTITVNAKAGGAGAAKKVLKKTTTKTTTKITKKTTTTVKTAKAKVALLARGVKTPAKGKAAAAAGTATAASKSAAKGKAPTSTAAKKSGKGEIVVQRGSSATPRNRKLTAKAAEIKAELLSAALLKAASSTPPSSGGSGKKKQAAAGASPQKRTASSPSSLSPSSSPSKKAAAKPKAQRKSLSALPSKKLNTKAASKAARKSTGGFGISADLYEVVDDDEADGTDTEPARSTTKAAAKAKPTKGAVATAAHPPKKLWSAKVARKSTSSTGPPKRSWKVAVDDSDEAEPAGASVQPTKKAAKPKPAAARKSLGTVYELASAVGAAIPDDENQSPATAAAATKRRVGRPRKSAPSAMFRTAPDVESYSVPNSPEPSDDQAGVSSPVASGRPALEISRAANQIRLVPAGDE